MRAITVAHISALCHSSIHIALWNLTAIHLLSTWHSFSFVTFKPWRTLTSSGSSLWLTLTLSPHPGHTDDSWATSASKFFCHSGLCYNYHCLSLPTSYLFLLGLEGFLEIGEHSDRKLLLWTVQILLGFTRFVHRGSCHWVACKAHPGKCVSENESSHWSLYSHVTTVRLSWKHSTLAITPISSSNLQSFVTCSIGSYFL